MTIIRSLIALIVAAALVGCATVPKPQELLDLEVMREAKDYEDAKDKQPDLTQESDDAHKKSVGAWEDEELELAKHWALLGTIKLRTALSLIKQETARQRMEAARKELAQVTEEHQDLTAKIKETDEQLELVAQLSAARKAAKEKEAALSAKLTEAQKREQEQKQLAEAQKKVGEAELAMKMADTVEAAKYAKTEYATAQSLMVRAKAALKAKNASDASATATMAKTRAEAAYHAARPKYLAAKQDAERKARNQALQKDAAAIGGVTVKMKSVGQTQQLIMPIVDLYKRANATPRPRKMTTLNEIGNLLKKYPEYPVIVNGYTSYRVRRSQRFAVSQARAQQVASHFVSMGVAFKRMAVAGHGSENMIGRRYSRINDRVEVVILFQ
jgi:outer membrane protein OmpA-like peptidoglycan-associated protein